MKMNMEKKIIKDLYCYLCSLQFDKRTIYDMHLSLVHNHRRKKDSFLTEIENVTEEIELEIGSNSNQTTSETLEITCKKTKCDFGEKPFTCKYCHKEYSLSKILKEHERIHSNEKPFACKYCDKKFTQSQQLKSHERIHTGEKPVDCNYCNKRFTLSHHLKRHERIHTGEKPFACKVCDKKFTQSQQLNSHERIHTCDKSLCKYCEKSFICF